MENFLNSDWPEIVFGTSDSAASQAIRRALRAGQLKKIAPRIYTSNLKSSPEKIIAKNCYYILGKLFPGAILSHRSALEGGISSQHSIVLTYKYTKKMHLPGLTVRLIKGKKAQLGDTPFMENLYIASRARALLENLQDSRGDDDIKKTISREKLEGLLDKLCSVYGEVELNQLRDQAKKLADVLQLKKEWHKLESLIGALLGTRPVSALTSSVGIARAQGRPYDVARLELFANLFTHIKKTILPIKNEHAHSSRGLQNLAFFESYFSNYIEGTEFEVEEAANIIFRHQLMPDRPKDAHDITATFEIVANRHEMNRIPKSIDDLIKLLKHRHQVLMLVRDDKSPGAFKKTANRVGNTIFVQPELVEGTLAKAFTLYDALDHGIARAMFIMFVVAEVHPFLDGNGRIARIMMNAELSYANQSRIIIPTVYREDYLLALRRLSREFDPEAYINMLIRAQAFTASIDFEVYEIALKQLKKSNAFMLPSEGKLRF